MLIGQGQQEGVRLGWLYSRVLGKRLRNRRAGNEGWVGRDGVGSGGVGRVWWRVAGVVGGEQSCGTAGRAAGKVAEGWGRLLVRER